MAVQSSTAVSPRRGWRINRWRDYDGSLVHRRVSWQALFAGLVIAITVELVLTVLGAAVGLSFVHTHAASTPGVDRFSTGAGIWWLVSDLIALLIGGYISARMAGVTVRYDGALHGLVTWALATLATVYLLTTTVGGLVGGASNILGTTIGAAGASLKTVAAPAIQGAVGQPGASPALGAYLQPTHKNPANMSHRQAQAAIGEALPVYEAGGQGAAAAKQRIIAIMAGQLKESPQQATDQFNRLQAKADGYKKQAVQKARRLAASGAHTASTGGYLAFAMLVLGALFGTLGGALAAPRRNMVAERETEAVE